MIDIHDRSRCYHCGAAGVPLVEWQPDPPRPDIAGPFPMVCADGCLGLLEAGEEPQDGDYSDGYTFATGGKVVIASHDPAATCRWLREIEIESDRDSLIAHFTD